MREREVEREGKEERERHTQRRVFFLPCATSVNRASPDPVGARHTVLATATLLVLL